VGGAQKIKGHNRGKKDTVGKEALRLQEKAAWPKEKVEEKTPSRVVFYNWPPAEHQGACQQMPRRPTKKTSSSTLAHKVKSPRGERVLSFLSRKGPLSTKTGSLIEGVTPLGGMLFTRKKPRTRKKKGHRPHRRIRWGDSFRKPSTIEERSWGQEMIGAARKSRSEKKAAHELKRLGQGGPRGRTARKNARRVR